MRNAAVPAPNRGLERAATSGERGLTLIELIVAFSILALLAMMAVPLAQYRVRRERETELRRALREMRTAIDKYKDACDFKVIPPGKIDSDCYPESLEQLVEGVRPQGSPDKKARFLRRIPRDPMTNSKEWGLRRRSCLRRARRRQTGYWPSAFTSCSTSIRRDGCA